MISDLLNMAVPRRSEFHSLELIFPKNSFNPYEPVKVIKAQHFVDDQQYAIKQLMVPDEAGEREALREIHAMAKFDHPNIVRYFNSWYSNTDLMHCREGNFKFL